MAVTPESTDICGEEWPGYEGLPKKTHLICTLPPGHGGEEHQTQLIVGEGLSRGELTLSWNPAAIAAMRERSNYGIPEGA